MIGSKFGPKDTSVERQDNICTSSHLDGPGQLQKQPKSNQIEQNPQEEDNGGFLQFMKDFMGLYNYGQKTEKILLILGILAGLASGLSFPLFTYFWGRQTDHIDLNFTTMASSLDQARSYYVAEIIIGIFALLINIVNFSIWKLLSVSISKKVRAKYITAFSKKSMKWIESQNLFETSSRFQSNCLAIEKAIGDKLALFYNLNGMLLSGSIIALYIRWTYTLFLFAILPFVLGVLGSFLVILIKRKILEKKLYRDADAQTMEAISLIKTVKLLGAQSYQAMLYQQKLDDYQQKISGEPIKLGITTGLFYFIQYITYGVGFMYATQCVRGTSACPISVTGSHYSNGQYQAVFFELFLCSFNFLQLATNFEAIRDAIKCSKEIYNFVQKAELEEIQYKETKLLKYASIDEFKDIRSIQFNNVEFSYPSNPQKKILQSLNISFLKNKFNAIVGSTGSGKLTVIQLLFKYYNISSGSIKISGINIDRIGVEELRSKIGYVGQQPTLFNGSVKENIRVGKENASEEEIYEVLKLVNLFDFIQSHPEGLDFNIGFGGSRLSGGQKQRIAIARVLIKKPELLILDQATSALDRKSEKVIQNTVRKLLSSNEDVTVICIAHRLKTICEADKIWYLQDGTVKGQGKFEQIDYFKNIKIDISHQQDNIQVNQDRHHQKQLPKEVVMHTASRYKQEDSSNVIFGRIYGYVQNKTWYAIAIIASVFNGLNHPGAAVLLAYFYHQLIEEYNFGRLTNWCDNSINRDACQASLDGYHHRAVKLMFGMIGFSFYAFFPYLIQITLMSKIEDQLTLKIRADLFDKLMKLPVAWHELPENEGGKAASRCGIDTKEVGGLITNFVPLVIANLCTMITGAIIPIFYSWKLGLLSLVAGPLIAISTYLSMIYIRGYEDESLHKYEHTDQIASQFIMSIRTIFSFNYQARMIERYKQLLEEPTIETLKSGAKIGLLFGISISMFIVTGGSQLFTGANILAYNQLESMDFVVLFTIPIWSGWIAGNSFFFASNTSAGKLSAKNIFAILDLKSQSDNHEPKIDKKQTINGKIEFRNVTFKYGSDESAMPIINNVSFTIEAGQKAAFVGHSGCGKSTILQLLQRFYEYEGEILLDDINILDYDLQQYREYFGVVSQQPNLFTGTLRQNIISNMLDFAEEDIFQVCELACAYDIKDGGPQHTGLKQKIADFLEQQVGVKGSKISGGEKQRTAVARALLRKPQIFLLDEGTSALDRETERKVQQNVDRKLKGKTMISIAHRIETIENSDNIFLFQEGKLIQQGKYEELMKKGSSFQKFVKGSE